MGDGYDYRARALALAGEGNEAAATAAAEFLHANESLHMHDNIEGKTPCGYCWLRAGKALWAVRKAGFAVGRPQPSPAARKLIQILKFRTTYGRPCYIKPANQDAALIVPHLTDGPDGPYSYLQTFRRATVEEAAALGLVELGEDRIDVPPVGGTHWAAQTGLKGRTITLMRREEPTP